MTDKNAPETKATIDYEQSMRDQLKNARLCHDMVLNSIGWGSAPETIAFWRTQRHSHMEGARFWRKCLRTQARRDLGAVRAWIRSKHLMVYGHARLLAQGEMQHCECCGAEVSYPTAVFYWSALETGEALTYRLCGYCDVQCKVLANQFVRDLKRAIFNPEEAIVGWPLHRAPNDTEESES